MTVDTILDFLFVIVIIYYDYYYYLETYIFEEPVSLTDITFIIYEVVI